MTKEELLFNSGVLLKERPGAIVPPHEIWKRKKNGFVIIECPQNIPCDPCSASCPTGAILPFEKITDLPRIDYSKCTGCSLCVAVCPGLACFVIDLTYGMEDQALIKLPYEMLPRPQQDEEVMCLGRTGEELCKGKVISITEPFKDRTFVVSVLVVESMVTDIRAVRVVKS